MPTLVAEETGVPEQPVGPGLIGAGNSIQPAKSIPGGLGTESRRGDRPAAAGHSVTRSSPGLRGFGKLYGLRRATGREAAGQGGRIGPWELRKPFAGGNRGPRRLRCRATLRPPGSPWAVAGGFWGNRSGGCSTGRWPTWSEPAIPHGAEGSTTVTIWSAGSGPSVCTIPEGQWISTWSAFTASLSPKCRVRSLVEA